MSDGKRMRRARNLSSPAPEITDIERLVLIAVTGGVSAASVAMLKASKGPYTSRGRLR